MSRFDVDDVGDYSESERAIVRASEREREREREREQERESKRERARERERGYRSKPPQNQYQKLEIEVRTYK